MTDSAIQPRGRRPTGLTAGRVGVYAFLAIAAAFFLLPAVIMVLTSLKTMDQIRQGHIFSLPESLDFSAWGTAWSSACTGLNCNGISVGFLNSVKILVPSTIISITVGAITGYALSLWNVRWANVLFGILLIGAFIPYQVFIYPLVRFSSMAGIFQTLPCIITIHTIFGLPLMTLIFRNYYGSLPIELFKAARVDGGGFWQIFFYVILPMSTPMIVVAAILQITGIWKATRR
jgi:glucose/mannose transport system permease protein